MRTVHRLLRAVLPALAVAVALPGTALAVTPPTILTAGFDAHDQLYATWSLAPGTTFSQVEFSSLPVPDADLPTFFADSQFADYDACEGEADCRGETSYTGDYPLKRDRRYFVKVTAAAGDDEAISAIWVIDETKPVVPGSAPIGEGDSNAPVAGKPWDGASLLPPGVVASASIKLLKVPKTIHGLLSRGVRVRVTSSVAYSVQTTLIDRGGRRDIIGLRSVGSATGGTRTVTATVDGRNRASLRAHKRAHLRLEVEVMLPDGTRTLASRLLTFRR
jgi:hypothetical protein